MKQTIVNFRLPKTFPNTKFHPSNKKTHDSDEDQIMSNKKSDEDQITPNNKEMQAMNEQCFKNRR